MQNFKVEEKQAKATLEIKDKKYEFFSPTAGQVVKFQKLMAENKGNAAAESEIMFEYLAELGTADVEILKSLDSQLFDDLFVYVITPQKKR